MLRQHRGGGLAPHPAPERTDAAALAVVIAVLAVLRLALGQYPLWFDELATLVFADQPLHQLWSGWMVHETNPPLFYTLVKGWQALGLTATPALRLLPLLGGILELGLLAIAARLGWGPKAAMTAVLLAGLSPLHIYASQLLRGYIFGADGVLLAFVGLQLMLRSDPGSTMARVPRAGLALYIGGSVVAIYCHTTLILWPPTAMTALVLAQRTRLINLRNGLVWRLLLANLTVLALAGWWLGVTLAQLRTGAANVAWIETHTVISYVDLVARSILLVNCPYLIERLLGIPIALALLAAAVAGWRTPTMRLVIAVIAVGVGLFGAVTLVHPIATGMTLFWLSPFVALALAGGLAQVRDPLRARTLRLLLLAVLATNLLMHGTQLSDQDFAGAVRTAAGHPGAVLLVEDETMGAVTARACTLAYPGRPCPVPILTVRRPDVPASWARALGTVPAVSAAALPATLGCCRPVYTLRTKVFDPLLHYGIAAPDSRRDWNDPFVEGPVPSERFKAADYRIVGAPRGGSQVVRAR